MTAATLPAMTHRQARQIADATIDLARAVRRGREYRDELARLHGKLVEAHSPDTLPVMRLLLKGRIEFGGSRWIVCLPAEDDRPALFGAGDSLMAAMSAYIREWNLHAEWE